MMPALFVGHGSPMNAIEENEFTRGWREIAQRVPKPKAVLCVSAHWETRGVYVTASAAPETIHDFYGFPKALFDVRYPAPGDPKLAARIAQLIAQPRVHLDQGRGLDHGSWSVLRVMYPRADVPVLQLSLDTSKPGKFHFELGRQLRPLRSEGVLILGSGNIVHNLGLMDWHRTDGFDWGTRFNDAVKQKILARDQMALCDYRSLDSDASLAVPSPEHYLPLLYPLAVQDEVEPATFFNDRVIMGSISMTSVLTG